MISGAQCISVLNSWSACSHNSCQVSVGPLLSLNVDGFGLNFFEICLLHLSPLVQASIKLSKGNQNKGVIYLQFFLSGKSLDLVKLISAFFSSVQYILLQKDFPKSPRTFTMTFDETKWKKYSLLSAWRSKRELLIHLSPCKLLLAALLKRPSLSSCTTNIVFIPDQIETVVSFLTQSNPAFGLSASLNAYKKSFTFFIQLLNFN